MQGGWVGGWVNATPVLFVLMELHAVHYWVVALQCKCSALCKVDGHGASPVRPRGTACSVLRIVCVQHGLQSLQSCHTVNIKGPPYLISCVGWMKVVPVLSILKAFTRPLLPVSSFLVAAGVCAFAPGWPAMLLVRVCSTHELLHFSTPFSAVKSCGARLCAEEPTDAGGVC